MSELPSSPEDAAIALPVSPTTTAPESGQNTPLTAGPRADESDALPPEGSDAFSHDGDDDLSSEEPDPEPSENVWESSVDPRSQNRERQRRDYRNKRFRLGGVRVDARGMGNAYGGDHHGDTVFNITTMSDTGGDGTAVPEEQIDFLQDVHVDGGTLRRLTSAFDNERVAVLHGDPETGRTTSAIIALRSVDHDNPVIRVTPEKLLSELSAPGADASHYLVRSTRRAWPWEDDEMVRVKSLLETQHSHLVVVIDDEDVPARWRSLLVRHTAPELLRVLHSHLTHHVGGEDAAGALLDRVRAQTRIKDCLDSIESPGEAARTAWFVKDQSDREEPDWLKRLADLLEKNRDEMLLQRARDLLRGLDHRHAPVDQAYVISAAVLDGHTLTTVVSAAGNLSERLVRAELGSRAQRRRIFERRLDHRLPHVRLKQQTSESGGAPPERTLQLRQPRLWSAVLDVAWTEYELSREPFLQWLLHLCEMASDDPRVRIDAAQAIGRIAAHDFAIVEKQVLKHWITTCEESSADDFDPQLPLMAAWIIEMLVVEGSQIDRAFDLLERWMREGSPWRLLYALTAYGTSIAGARPEESFRAIDMAASEIGRSGMGRAFGPATGTAGRLDQFVESAVVEAFDGNSPRARAMALEHLVTWHRDDQRPRLHRVAVRTLLKIAQLPTRCQDGSRGRDFALVEWLAAVVADPDTYGATPTSAADTVEGVHGLWLDALSDDDLSPAWTVLDDWEARYPDATATPAARAQIDALLERIRSDPSQGLKERLSLYTIIRERRNGAGRTSPTPA